MQMCTVVQSFCRWRQGGVNSGVCDLLFKKRKSEQAHIPHAPTLLENAVYNEWQFQALVTGNRTKKGI